MSDLFSSSCSLSLHVENCKAISLSLEMMCFIKIGILSHQNTLEFNDISMWRHSSFSSDNCLQSSVLLFLIHHLSLSSLWNFYSFLANFPEPVNSLISVSTSSHLIQLLGVSSEVLKTNQVSVSSRSFSLPVCFKLSNLRFSLAPEISYKEIQPVHPKGDQSWVFIGRTDAEAETPILWLPDMKNWLIWKDPDSGKDWRQEEKGMTEDEKVGWHHQLNGHEFE